MTDAEPTTADELRLEDFIATLDDIVAQHTDERTTTAAVAEALGEALRAGFPLDPRLTVPREDRYVMYPVHVDPAGRYSIASAVWNVGQATPVHGHETWGVVGIYSGAEHEVGYVKPQAPGVPLEPEGEHTWQPGEVTVCCTTDHDVHEVSCEGDVPCVGIHVYGADIGTLSRRSYEAATGEVSWFVSTWGAPEPARP